MHVRVVVDPSRVWRWHVRLVSALTADGHFVDIAFVPTERRRARPPLFGLLAALERIIARGPPLRNAVPAEAAHIQAPLGDEDASPAMILDVSGVGVGASDDRHTLLYDDGGEHDAVLALCAGLVPRLSMCHGGRIVRQALPAVERPHLLSRALDNVFSRALTLCRAAVRHPHDRAAHGLPAVVASGRSSPRPFAAAAARLVTQGVAARLQALVRTAPKWTTGFRRTSGDRVVESMRWPDARYTALADDGRRFFADPFPFVHGGTRYLFVEEYQFATDKGVISYVALDSDDRASAPRPALEAPSHLSYPMIFERGGAVYMIPESSGARTIDLYRADPFPDRWTLERTLVNDVNASDMTLLEHDGRLWLLGTVAEEGESTWEGLSAFVADDLMGPWRPHSHNPLLIDASSARPAGMPVATEGGLIRPAQDCRRGYGRALALARIDRLDDDGFSQTVLASLPPDERWDALGVHTLNEAGGLEVVDWLA